MIIRHLVLTNSLSKFKDIIKHDFFSPFFQQFSACIWSRCTIIASNYDNATFMSNVPVLLYEMEHCNDGNFLCVASLGILFHTKTVHSNYLLLLTCIFNGFHRFQNFTIHQTPSGFTKHRAWRFCQNHFLRSTWMVLLVYP